MEYLAVLKKALKDPKVQGLSCISPNNKPKLLEILRELPSTSYLSEWKYGMGQIKYVYHVHNGKGVKLKEAFDNGARGGHPKLTGVYSKKDLQAIIQKY